jgi:hypothetical protein
MGFVPLISQSLEDVKFSQAQVLTRGTIESPTPCFGKVVTGTLPRSTYFSAPCASSLNLPRSFLASGSSRQGAANTAQVENNTTCCLG